MEYAHRWENEETDLEVLGECLVYLRDTDRFMEHEIGFDNRWCIPAKYGPARRPTDGKGYFDRCKNASNGTFYRGALGLGEYAVALKMKKLIFMRIASEIGIIVNIDGVII